VPELVGDHRVEVGDVADAVAAQLEGIGVAADQVLAGVEVVLPRPDRRRVAVGHDHLGDRGPLDDRAVALAVAERDPVQHKAFAGVEADAQRPVLPSEEVAVEGEAGPRRLGDLDRLLRGAGRAGDGRVVEVARLGGDRHGSGVDDLVDGLGHDVDVGDQAVDGMGPGVVLRVVLDEGEAAQDPPPALLGVLEHAGRKRGDAHVGDVQVPRGQSGQPALVGGEDPLHQLELFVEHRQLAVDGGVEPAFGHDRPRPDGDEDVVATVRGDVVQQDADDAVGEGVLRRLFEAEVGHARGRGQQAGVGEHLPGGGDLAGGQRGERVGDVGRGRGGGHQSGLPFSPSVD
jgi:hypothetical protein